jgi:hypothetical protein
VGSWALDHWVSDREAWQEISVMGPQGLLQKARPYVGPFLQWAVSAAGGIGATFLQFLLTAVLSAVLKKSFTDHVRSLTQTAIRRDSQSVPLPSAQGI